MRTSAQVVDSPDMFVGLIEGRIETWWQIVMVRIVGIVGIVG
jgi:hypothetical protein